MKPLLFIIVFTANIIQAQQTLIKGKVIDSNTKKPLIGVTIYNAKKTSNAVTDFNGTYKIYAEIGDSLTFSMIGYKTSKQPINNKELIVLLEENSIELNEIEVLAHKNINDIDLRKATGSITTVPINKIKNRSSVNIIESLQGQVAGLTVKTNGELGTPLKIRIRGTSTLPIKTKGIKQEDLSFYDNKANQPLFVLDGQVISPDAFATLNINDIENIKVLKDPVANALYGIKAANGVIEITSKRGINGKTAYSFSFQQGITLRGKPSVQMMDSNEKLTFERLSKNKNTPGYIFSEEYIRNKYSTKPNVDELVANGAKKLDSLQKINTNWFKELTKINTYQSYNISSRGGNEKNKFYISGNFTQQGGKFDGNEIQRFTGRLNYEYNLTSKIYVILNSGLGFTESNTPHSSSYSPSELIYSLNPYEQKDKGILVSYPNRTYANLINQFSKNSTNNRFNFSANLFAKLSKSLHLSSVVGLDYLTDESLAIVPPTSYSEIKSKTPVKERGKADKRKAITKNYSTNTRLNFNKSFGNHKLAISANMDFYKNMYDFIGISGYGLPSKLYSGAGINNELTGSKKAKTASKKTTDAQLGFGFSALYEWNKTVEIYGSYKNDGSSLLPNDKRWNTFWATGIGYSFNNLNFIKNSNWLHTLKLRTTYGATASLAGITASLAVPTFTYGSHGYLGIREFYLKDLYNKDLRPEKNKSINIALDIGIANRFTMTIEAYHRRTHDMLLTTPIAPSNGFKQQLKNVGIMDNKGLEFSINSTLFNTDNFSWQTSANLSYNQNKVVDLYEGTTLSLSNNPYPDYKEGEPADLIYGLISLGIHPADGTPRFQRADGTDFNGVEENPTSEDFIVLGHYTPPINGGWYHSLNYKNWQLSFDLYYAFGGKAIYTNQSVAYEDGDTHKNAVKGQVKNTWFTIGDEGKQYPSLKLGTGEFYVNKGYASTKNTGRTDFIRLNNVMIRYHFNKSYLQKISNSFITNWQMYLQLKNIATWSNFNGGDPESGNLSGSIQPIITIGANLSF